METPGAETMLGDTHASAFQKFGCRGFTKVEAILDKIEEDPDGWVSHAEAGGSSANLAIPKAASMVS